jgi:hypothetical protein
VDGAGRSSAPRERKWTLTAETIKNAPRTNWAVVRGRFGIYHLTGWRVEANEHFRSLVCSPMTRAERPDYQPTLEGCDYTCMACEKATNDG